MTKEIIIDGGRMSGIKTLRSKLKYLEQENKELQAYKDINEDFKKAWDELNGKYKRLRSALEEIKRITEEDRNCMNSELACCQLCDKLDLIKDKIKGVLGDEA